jgi:hypothetical protein
MISIELVKAVQADRERQLAARHRHHSTEGQGRRIRINRRSAGR